MTPHVHTHDPRTEDGGATRKVRVQVVAVLPDGTRRVTVLGDDEEGRNELWVALPADVRPPTGSLLELKPEPEEADEDETYYDPMASTGHRLELGLEPEPPMLTPMPHSSLDVRALMGTASSAMSPSLDSELPPLPLAPPVQRPPAFAFDGEMEAKWQRRAQFETEERRQMLQAQRAAVAGGQLSASPLLDGSDLGSPLEANRNSAKNILKSLVEGKAERARGGGGGSGLLAPSYTPSGPRVLPHR